MLSAALPVVGAGMGQVTRHGTFRRFAVFLVPIGFSGSWFGQNGTKSILYRLFLVRVM